MRAASPIAGTSDIVIVGGGLAGGLLALKLADARPEYSVTLLERGPQPRAYLVVSRQ
jgi:choline dehydrogenase-like flavoprotein